MGPLEVPIDELARVIGLAEAETVEEERLTRARKKLAYATRAQQQQAAEAKQWAEWSKPTLADSFELLNNNFGYHGYVNYDYNVKKLGQDVLKR